MSLTWPVDVAVSQQFGANPNSIQPNGHTGVDFATPLNTPVRAAGDGTVLYADWANKLSSSNQWWIAPTYAGIVVLIDHGNGLITLYAHLNGTDLSEGQFVTQGQQIGISGSTGLSTGPHLHFEVLGWPLQPYNGFYGRLDPNLYCSSVTAQSGTPTLILNDNQRQNGPDSTNVRDYPGLGGKVIGAIAPNAVQTFDGYVVGDMIGDYNVWYKGTDGYVWSGAFTEASTKGLQNLTAQLLLAPNQRLNGADPVSIRDYPGLAGKIIGTVQPNTVQTFKGYAVGDFVQDYNVWYKGDTGYVWSGAFTEASTRGLTNLTAELFTVPSTDPAPATPPAPTTSVPVPTTPATGYSFTPDFDFVEYIPAAAENVIPGQFPAQPTHAVIHQFGTVGRDTVTSTVNTFTSPNLGDKAVSAHFVVSGKRIIQMVSLKDRAFHAYVVGNDYIGIETDPLQDADTVESTKKLLAAIRDKYGYLPTLIRHKDVPKCVTSCGSLIDLSRYAIDAIPAPAPTPEPVPVPTPAPVVSEQEILTDFVYWLVSGYLKSK